MCVVACAFSPIDLIPDPIPVLGYLDDLILLALTVAVVRQLTPAEVLEDCRPHADERMATGKPPSWVAAAVILPVCLVVAVLVVRSVRGLWVR